MSSDSTPSDPLKEPPFILPSHISDIDHWKHPDRNFYVFIILSFVFGFIGLDHFYLRSFGSGMQKFGFNIISLGFWYFWDLIQIVSDGKRVKEEGLTTPFDWIRGIGRGVFEDSAKKTQEPIQQGGGNGSKVMMAKKDIFIYSILTLFGIFGLDKFYLGEPLQGIAKMLTCFNIFIFLFGWLWVVWDVVKVFIFTDSIMKYGISPPPPYSFIFSTPISGQEMFIPREVSTEEAAKMTLFASIMDMFHFKLPGPPALPVLPTIDSLPLSALSVFLPKLNPPPMPSILPKMPSLSSITGTKPGSLINGSLASDLPQVSPLPQMPTALPQVPTALPQMPTTLPQVLTALPQVPTALPQVPTSLSQVPTLPSAPASKLPIVTQSVPKKSGTMVGGGTSSSADSSELNLPGPIIAGTLAAVVLAGASKFLGELLTANK